MESFRNWQSPCEIAKGWDAQGLLETSVLTQGVAQEGLTREKSALDPASTLIPSNGHGPDGGALCLLHIVPDLTMILCPRGPGTN